MVLAELEQELRDLKARVERLEILFRQALHEGRALELPTSVESLMSDLHQRGLLTTPPPPVLAAAFRWRSLPPEIQEMIRHEADHLPPGPTASDQILEDRQ